MGAESTTEPGGTQATTPAGTPEAASGQQGAGGGQSEADRLARLEQELAALKGQAHAGSQQVVQERLDAPGATADEVRRQLEERDRQRAAAEKEKAGESRIAQLEQQIKEMKEKPPEPPLRRVERFMGWRRA